MKFLSYCPLEGEKLQFMGGVVGFSLCQTHAGIGNDGIITVIMSLVEDSPQARPASVSVQFERPHEISIGMNGHCGAQALQVIKGPLTHVIPSDSHLLLACSFARCQFMQGSSYLYKLGNELSVIPHKPQKTLDLSDGGGGRPFLYSIYFAVISGYSLSRNDIPGYVSCLQNGSHLEGLSFSPASSTFLKIASSLWDGWLALSR